uniref:Uncharacterized protein n=1 Tax=Myoviridae sp. ctrnx29 TaxID=2826704 RepID=A0A8S5LYD0_9CAUD|nr:MAG TPA: hypothetical protein [Myoviridae sp. ctrnx29]
MRTLLPRACLHNPPRRNRPRALHRQELHGKPRRKTRIRQPQATRLRYPDALSPGNERHEDQTLVATHHTVVPGARGLR